MEYSAARVDSNLNNPNARKKATLKLGQSKIAPSYLSVLARVVFPHGHNLFRMNTGWLDTIRHGESTVVEVLCERTGVCCYVVVYKERILTQGFLDEDWLALLRFGKVLYGAACALGVNWKYDVGHIT